MKQIYAVLVSVAVVLTCEAQQPGRAIRQSGPQVSQSSGEPQTKNYQLELTMVRSGKTARYRMVFNGGQISTDLVDKLAEPVEGVAPRTMSFSASLNPFDEGGGGEMQLFIGRAVPYLTKSKDGAGQERNLVQERTMGLTTKMALRPGKAVVLFDDEEEKITLKLTEM